MKKTINFIISDYEGEPHKPYYSARIGRTEILFSMTDTYLSFQILLWGYYKDYRCNTGYCKKSEDEACNWANCRNKIKIPDIYAHYIDCDSFDHISHLLNKKDFSDTPIEKIQLAKQFLIRLINNDPICFDPIIDFICPKRDIKRFESSFWNIDGVLV